MNGTNRIQVHDRIFEKSIDFQEINAAIDRIAASLNRDFISDTPLFLAILNGSFMFAADLLKKIEFPCEISFLKIASYSGTSSTEAVRRLIGIDEELTGRTVVIIEDIIDTGLTLEHVIGHLREMGAKEVRIASLLFKPDAFRGDYPVDYLGMEIPNEFIVGYGLDYNKHGRNFKDIYKIVE